MSSVNKVQLIGNLCADPDSRFTPNGQAVCEMRLATNESWTDKAGQKQEKAEFHRLIVWGKQAEACGKYLAKGRQIYVEGKLTTRTYDDKDGNKKYITEIVCSDVQFLGGPSGDEKQPAKTTAKKPAAKKSREIEALPNDDLPY